MCSNTLLPIRRQSSVLKLVATGRDWPSLWWNSSDIDKSDPKSSRDILVRSSCDGEHISIKLGLGHSAIVSSGVPSGEMEDRVLFLRMIVGSGKGAGWADSRLDGEGTEGEADAKHIIAGRQKGNEKDSWHRRDVNRFDSKHVWKVIVLCGTVD